MKAFTVQLSWLGSSVSRCFWLITEWLICRQAAEVIWLHVFMEEGEATVTWTLRTADLRLEILGLTHSFYHQMLL